MTNINKLNDEDLIKVQGGIDSNDKFEQLYHYLEKASEEELIAIFKEQYELNQNTNLPLIVNVLKILKDKYNVEFKDDKLYKNGIQLY